MMKNIIFDRKGAPSLRIVRKSYLASCRHNIYAGYIEKDRVHDFNGTQRGWFDDGILRDLGGKCVGFVASANGKCHPVFPSIKTLKSFVKLTAPPLKPVSQEKPFSRPDFKKEWADKNPSTLMMIP